MVCKTTPAGSVPEVFDMSVGDGFLASVGGVTRRVDPNVAGSFAQNSYATVPLMLASTRAGKGPGTIWQGGGFRYEEVDPSTPIVNGYPLLTGGGVKLKVLPGDDGFNVKAFNARGDWNGTTGTDDTSAIQKALDVALALGAGVIFPDGRYRTTAPLVIDASASTLDPTDGGRMLSLRGSGPASCQIAANHNGTCIAFTGGASAGWHTYFYIDGLGLTKTSKAREAGSIGLSLDDCAFAQFQRFDISYFEYGIYGLDVLSTSFSDGTIRLNNYGWRFAKGTRSHPNNIAFRGVVTLNNQIWGGQIIQPSLFDYFGGSIESNGYTGTPGDTLSWGVDIQNGGTEGSVAVNFVGTYIENNNGRADVKILSDTKEAVYNFNGCSFLRFLDPATRYTTNNIFFNSITDSKLVLTGCGFKEFSPYVSSASRLFVSANTAQVSDMGGNVFIDTAGSYTPVALLRAVFEPFGSNHSINHAALPDVVKFRNGFQYCPDGTGGSTPSLAVSDGAKWLQIPAVQSAGTVDSTGSPLRLPRGWTSTKTGTGIYVITHNLGIGANTYAVTASPIGTPGTGFCSGMALSTNSFEIYLSNTAGAATDMKFSFVLMAT